MDTANPEPNATGEPRTDCEAAFDLILPIAIASYPEAERRRDVIEKRLQDVMAFFIALTTALVATGTGRKLVYDCTFWTAIALFAIGMVIGIATRLSGGLRLLNTTTLYSQAHLNVVDIKQSLIGHAGTASEENARGTAKKHRLTVLVTIIFGVEIVLLILWLALGKTS